MVRVRKIKASIPFAARLGAALLAAPLLASPAAAQSSDAATAPASVTVESPAVNVVWFGTSLTFGTHFASEGPIQNTNSASWGTTVDDATKSVDYVLTQLPTSLSDGAGNSVPLTYGIHSLSAQCINSLGASQTFFADPTVGFSDCLPVGNGVNPNVWIGKDAGGTFSDGSEFVEVDLNGAPAGTYTGTLELTATIN
jgi:hypothetical protein